MSRSTTMRCLRGSSSILIALLWTSGWLSLLRAQPSGAGWNAIYCPQLLLNRDVPIDDFGYTYNFWVDLFHNGIQVNPAVPVVYEVDPFVATSTNAGPDGRRRIWRSGLLGIICWQRQVQNGNVVLISNVYQVTYVGGTIEPEQRFGDGGGCADTRLIDDGTQPECPDGGGGGGGGGSDDPGGGSGSNCHQEWVIIEQQSADGSWHTVWEGQATVCE